MAATLKLVQRDDFTADISSLDLTAYNAGITVAENGWQPGQLADGADRIQEAMTLRIKGTSVDDLVANEQALANMVRLVGISSRAAERYGIWLQAKVDGETNARQAYITKASHLPVTQHTSWDVRKNFRFPEYTLGLERMPYWEDTAAIAPHAYYIGSVGSMIALGTTTPGDVTFYGDQPARLAEMDIYANNVTVGPLTKLWLGFRSTQNSQPRQFSARLVLGTCLQHNQRHIGRAYQRRCDRQGWLQDHHHVCHRSNPGAPA